MASSQIRDFFQPWITSSFRAEVSIFALLGLCLLWRLSVHMIVCFISGVSAIANSNQTKYNNARVPKTPGFPPVETLENFDWKTTEPIKLRPFKPIYHLTMGLTTLNPSELIPMDQTYKERLAVRKSLLESQHDTVVAVNNDSYRRVRAAVMELYMFILGTYLPGRYPSMFGLHGKTKTPFMENLVTGEIWPVVLDDTTPTIRALETLAQVVDEDFLILLPEQKEKSMTDNGNGGGGGEEPRYILEAYEACFPSGFNPRKKLGLRLADIHGPVPYYREKLERSMDRFFAKVEVGKYVKRANWSVTMNTNLFAAFGATHGVKGEELENIKPGELDLDRTLLRCERQTLHRLPTSKALVFGIHTYTYPLQNVKDEGLGEDMAQAIDGLKKGTGPEIHFYKRGPVWGEAVKEFLRS